MRSEPRIAAAAALIGNPGRAAMLGMLMDGRALPAGELAMAAGLSAAGASDHLAQLLSGGLLTVIREGRHRYYRLANEHVAAVLEGLATLGDPRLAPRTISKRQKDNPLRFARTCYDHLAGQLGVGLAASLTERGYVELSSEGGAVTEAGIGFCRDFGVDLDAGRGGHVYCRPCLDWSERRLHIGGAFGAALAARCFALNWIRRSPESRAVSVTPAGERGFRERFGV